MRVTETRDFRGRMEGYTVMPDDGRRSVVVELHEADELMMRDERAPTVNWAACGAVPAEDAAEYARCLLVAAGLVDAHLVRRAERAAGKRDGCQLCHGDRGCTPGNENVVDGVRMCDCCHSAMMLEAALARVGDDGRPL